VVAPTFTKKERKKGDSQKKHPHLEMMEKGKSDRQKILLIIASGLWYHITLIFKIGWNHGETRNHKKIGKKDQ
jgi:hypothetical protein